MASASTENVIVAMQEKLENDRNMFGVEYIEEDCVKSKPAKRRKSSKLKQRRNKSKLKSKETKQAQIRQRKLENENKISTNEMYPNFKPLTESDIEYISKRVIDASMNDLELSPNLGKECDDGPIEFKWKIVSPSVDRLQRRLDQMIYRLNEGNGRCLYQIGVEDDGNPKGLSDKDMIETIKTIYRMNKQINGKISITAMKRGQYGKVATLEVTNASVLDKSKQVKRGSD